MAGGIKRGKIWRKIHLFSSMMILVFTAFFMLSGLMMIRHDLFPEGKPVIHVNRLPLSVPFRGKPEVFGKELRRVYDLHGRMDKPSRIRDGRWRFFFARPGITQEVLVSTNLDSVQIRQTEQQTAVRVINRIHHLRGYKGGWKYAIWGVLYDLSALSLIVFALTGVFMWFRMRKNYRAGWFFLGTGFGVTLLVILSMYFLG